MIDHPICRRYFVPAEIVLVVEHGVGLGKDMLIGAIHQFLRDHPKLNLEFDGERILDFPSSPPFALVFATVNGIETACKDDSELDKSDEIVLATIRSLNEEFTKLAYRFDAETALKMDYQLKRPVFAKDFGPGRPLPRRGMRFAAASPNWLMGGAQTQKITGGPSAKPQGVPDPNIQGYSHTFSRPQELTGIRPQGERESQMVEVAILDTAPSVKLIAAAQSNTLWQSHQILRDLGIIGGGSNPLEIIYWDARFENFQNEYSILEQDYQMPDHGLFAAGIVRTIAPHAHLRLIQVLNDYGVGTLETIGAGLQMLANERRNPSMAPLVINMSLVFSMPLDVTQEFDGRRLDLSGQDTVLLMYGLERMCGELDQSNAVLVAAAGNDRDGTNYPQPPARYPAAFPTVTGVGAIDTAGQDAAYSNIADNPYVPDGMRAIGGDLAPAQPGVAEPLANVNNGIVGVYIGPLPTGTNTSGWARWAGTSFAAPVVSAAIANIFEERADPEDPVTRQMIHDAVELIRQG